MGDRCGAIRLIALFVALSDQASNQERGEGKQLAPPPPYSHSLTDLTTSPPSDKERFAEAQRPNEEGYSLEGASAEICAALEKRQGGQMRKLILARAGLLLQAGCGFLESSQPRWRRCVCTFGDPVYV